MRKKIVIIDDEFFFRQALIKYIEKFSDEFIVVGDAGNGEKGIFLIEQHNPDIILIDISMPQMTGFEVIQHIEERKRKSKFIIISGYDKFEYAQQAIKLGVQDFLLKPVTTESLYKSLKKVGASIDEEKQKVDEKNIVDKKKYSYQKYMKHFVASQFIRQDMEQEQMRKLAEEIGYNFSHSMHLAILYHVNHLPSTWNENEFELYYFTVSNVFCELLGNEVSCIDFINFQGSLCFIIGIPIIQAGDFNKWISGILQKVVSVCDETHSLQSTVCVGRLYSEMSSIYRSYIEAFSLEKKALFYEMSGIYFSEEAIWNASDNNILQQNGEIVTKLLQGIRQNQKAVVYEITNTFIEYMVEMRLSKEQFLLQINKILSEIVIFAKEYGIRDAVSRNNKLFSADYMNTSTVSEIRTELLGYVNYIFVQVHSAKISNTSAVVKRVKEYIKVNYTDSQLCLEQISDSLGVNLQYMCFLFKKQTDMTIGNYILQTRMEMASRLFKRTGCNVSEVAEKVGFDDVGYFSKCFKKYFGVSPKKYQNICQTETI